MKFYPGDTVLYTYSDGWVKPPTKGTIVSRQEAIEAGYSGDEIDEPGRVLARWADDDWLVGSADADHVTLIKRFKRARKSNLPSWF